MSQRAPRMTSKPEHYKVICISMYTADLKLLDEKVQQLQTLGISGMSRSRLIRIALEQVDLVQVASGVKKVPTRGPGWQKP